MVSKAPFIFFPDPSFLKYCPNEVQEKDTKNLQEKVIYSKQHNMSFISDTFISNTG